MSGLYALYMVYVCLAHCVMKPLWIRDVFCNRPKLQHFGSCIYIFRASLAVTDSVKPPDLPPIQQWLSPSTCSAGLYRDHAFRTAMTLCAHTFGRRSIDCHCAGCSTGAARSLTVHCIDLVLRCFLPASIVRHNRIGYRMKWYHRHWFTTSTLPS